MAIDSINYKNLNMLGAISLFMEADDTDDDLFLSNSTSEDSFTNEDIILKLATSSDEDNSVASPKRRKLANTAHNPVETGLPTYNDSEFKQRFRLSKTTAHHVIETVRKARVLPTHAFGREKIGAEKAVLMTIAYLSNSETFVQISERFRVTQSAAYRVISKIVKFLVSISKQYIKWPQEIQTTKQGFKELGGIDGVLGAIDVCHIGIKKPANEAYKYCNNQAKHSILVQAVCDHEKRFVDFFCGEPGSLHDATLLERSSLFEKAMKGCLGDDFILGGSAYPCLSWLITPYTNDQVLTLEHRTFNQQHSSCRVVIDNAFRLLKGRFKRLKRFENDNVMFIIECVIASAVLHNICLDFGDEAEYDADDFMESEPWDDEAMAEISEMQANDERRNEIFLEMFN